MPATASVGLERGKLVSPAEWSLSLEQLAYAAADVEVLIELDARMRKPCRFGSGAWGGFAASVRAALLVSDCASQCDHHYTKASTFGQSSRENR